MKMNAQPVTRFTICAWDEVLGQLADKRYDAVISIEHPGATPEFGRVPDIADHGHDIPHHRLTFWDNDVEDMPDMFTPALGRQTLGLLRHYRGESVLVHCRAGKARSGGVVLMGIADELGTGCEAEACLLLNKIRPIATPNPLVVRIADDLLERGGALVKAVEENQMIASLMPNWYVAKVRSMMRFNPDLDPEKQMPFMAGLSPERREQLIAEAKAKAWKPTL